MHIPQVYGLRCEYLENPVGVDAKAPRFSWKISHSLRGQKQQAYHLRVATSLAKLVDGKADKWDSNKVASSQSLQVRYDGKPLSCCEKLFWTVRVCDERGVWSAFSDPATFTMGLLSPSDWKGKWLGFAGGANGCGLLVRRAFTVDKPPVRALVFAAFLGYGELYINGEKIGDRVLEPAETDCSKHVLYSSYDVSGKVSSGENVVGLMLGNGWYGAPKFLFQMHLFFEDNTEQILVSDLDTNWKIGRGAIVQNSIFDGEIYDARLEKEDWNTTSHNLDAYDRVKNGWIHAMAVEAPCGKLVSQMMPPIRVVENITLTKIHRLSPKIAVFDVGKNIAGWVKITVCGNAGSAVALRYAETLHEDGTVNQKNLRTAQAVDTYILKGSGKENYSPRFTYHGFRYVQVEQSGGAEVLSLQACQVRSDVERIGRFHCSSGIINRIEDLIINTENANYHGIPTDCPQRDERMGWLNDATVRMEEAVYHFDLAALLEKWMWDIADTQDESGAIADTAPFHYGTRPGDPVCTSFLLIPWYIYLHYGDITCLQTHYEAMKKWVHYLESISENHIISYSRFGDWASPRSESQEKSLGSGAASATTPGSFMSTCYQYYNAVLMAKFASLLGKPDDIIKFERLAQNTKAAILSTFYDPGTGKFALGSQGAQAFALLLDIPPEDDRYAVLERLLEQVRYHDYHLSTGNQTTKYLLEVLTREGLGNVAYQIVTQKTYPGWGFMLENGATTLWERWELETDKGMNSHNHPMHGAIGSWFFQSLAGVSPDASVPGYGSISIRPVILRELEYAAAEIETPRGPLFFRWSREDGGIRFAVKIPVNATATLRLPFPTGSLLTENDTPLYPAVYAQMPQGILSVAVSDGWLELTLGSGEYDLLLKQITDIIRNGSS